MKLNSIYKRNLEVKIAKIKNFGREQKRLYQEEIC